MPTALIAEAERRQLPLVALHREIPFVEVTEAVHRAIVSRQLELMRHGDEMQRRFTTVFLSGGGVPEVLDALADAAGNPVVLERAGSGVLYHVSSASHDAEVLAASDSYRQGLGTAPPAIELPTPADEDGQWGRIVVLALNRPPDMWSATATERVVGLIARALLREREEELVAARERGNFLVALLTVTLTRPRYADAQQT